MSFSALFELTISRKNCFILLFFLAPQLFAQNISNEIPGPDSSQKGRLWLVGGISVAAYGGSLVILSKAWFEGFPKTGFHTFNDSKEWLQVDKLGHGWSAYQAGKVSASLWKWAGLTHKKAVLVGGLSGAVYLTVIEFLDAHSARWGWSWADMGANLFGSGLFISQELAWQEQKLQYKFSFHRPGYPDQMSRQRAADLYGNNFYERLLKDYNGQTYWFSLNLASVFKRSKLPAWLNLALGYGADGMLGGFENKWATAAGDTVNRFDIPRKRQFYLSPDLDFSKFRTNSRFLKVIFDLLNMIKMPAPAIMLDSRGKWKVYAVYF